ncbi:MAG: OmpH family outer membrane protein [Bacteroidales bacterium]|nr:OmpH family outer membrane protein [Bacteroidales bacterium]
MFKKIILFIARILPMSVMAQKFGVVNLDEVFTAMPETAEMQKQMEQISQKFQAEFDKLQEAVNQKYTEYQNIANDTNTPDAIKERRMQEIQELANNVDKFRNQAQQDIARQQEQLAAPIQQKITDAINAVGQENGFTFIFPNEPGLLLYKGTDVVDVTPMIRTKLGL